MMFTFVFCLGGQAGNIRARFEQMATEDSEVHIICNVVREIETLSNWAPATSFCCPFLPFIITFNHPITFPLASTSLLLSSGTCTVQMYMYLFAVA